MAKTNEKFILRDPALSAIEAAPVVGMSLTWFKKNWRKENIPAVRVGKRSLRWRLSVLTAYLDRKTFNDVA